MRYLLLLIPILVAGVLFAIDTADSSADKGGCPNAASSNGAAHANPKSAHGPEKQAANGCVAATMEPTPAPTSAPTDEPTAEPTAEPTSEPTDEPTAEPTETPTSEPTGEATPTPTARECL